MAEKSAGNSPEGLAGLCWRLQRLQRASGVKQSALAAAVGVSPQTMSQILNGDIRRIPPVERMRLMVQVCRKQAKEKGRSLPADLADPAAWELRYLDLEQNLDAPTHVRAGRGIRVSAAAKLLSAKAERPYEDVPVALAQLPPEFAGFVGRSDELAVLAGQFDPAQAAGTIVVSAVGGLAGVSKTTLAVKAGHSAVRRGWFPGGVLFVNLHGYDEAPVQPGQTLEALLRALGVPAAGIPPTVEERAGLYRSRLAQIPGSVLLIADNASTEAQVRPLLPGTGRHKVLITSRDTLAALGARLVDVTIMDNEDALTLLNMALRVARPDDERITADRQAAGRLAYACGGLPLALQITAALLITDPALSVAALADELAVEAERLERLRYDDGSGTGAPSVAAAFELSYRRLDDAPARLFRLMPVNPRPDASTKAIAALANLTVAKTREVLAKLARAHLIEAVPGATGRWRMHDLMHLYAQQLSDTHAGRDRREQARDRLFSYYLAFAKDHQAEKDLDALEAEITGLMGALTWARDHHRYQDVVGLARSLNQFLFVRGHIDEARLVRARAVQAAQALDSKDDSLWSLHQLAMLDGRTGRPSEARAGFNYELQLARDTGDFAAERAARRELGLLSQKAGQFAEALTEYQQALVLAEGLGDPKALFAAVLDLAQVHRFSGRATEAGQNFERALKLAREVGEPWALGVALSDYGDFLREAGDRPRARVLLNEAIQVSGRIDYAYRLGKCYQYLAKLLEQDDDKTGAVASYRTALGYFERVGAAELKEVPADLLALEADPEIVRAVRVFAGATRQEEAQSFLEREQSLLLTDAAEGLLDALADQVRQNVDQEAEATRSAQLKIRLHELRNARTIKLSTASLNLQMRP
jgi:tetratricopeptide (TPR) repeat protein/transcriptional regulator with XRE-family HTH domain